MKFWVGDRSVTVNIPDWTTLEVGMSERFKSGRGFFLATLNLDHLAKLRTNRGMQVAYDHQDFVCADGNPIVWMSEMAQQPVTLMPGSDLVVPLAQFCAQKKLPIALIGPTDEVLRKSTAALEAKAPGLEVVYTAAPSFGFRPNGQEAEDILKELAGSRAKFCFVALGAPRQELFALVGRDAAPQVGFACIGAGLDFLAGDQIRAPLLVRKLALEWMWRLLSNPSRFLKRYMDCFAILPGHIFRSMFRSQSMSDGGDGGLGATIVPSAKEQH